MRVAATSNLVAASELMSSARTLVARVDSTTNQLERNAIQRAALDDARRALALISKDDAGLLQNAQRAVAFLDRPVLGPGQHGLIENAVSQADVALKVAARGLDAAGVRARLSDILAESSEPGSDQIREVIALVHDLPEGVRFRPSGLHAQNRRFFESIASEGWAPDDGNNGIDRDLAAFDIKVLQQRLSHASRAAVANWMREIMSKHPSQVSLDDLRSMKMLTSRVTEKVSVPIEEIDVPTARVWSRYSKWAHHNSRPGTLDSHRLVGFQTLSAIGDVDSATAALRSLDNEIARSAVALVYPDVRLDGDAVATLEHWMNVGGGKYWSLEAMRSNLYELAATAHTFVTDRQPATYGLAQEVTRMVHRNIERIDGKRRDGYMKFPDYGELGDLIANVRLLRALHAPPESAASVSW
jgi:hypothetical protein